jgi:hypothetical protein
MASNTTLNSGSGGDTAVTVQVSHDGDTAKLQGVFLMGIAGSEDSYTVAKIDGDATNGLDVDVTRVIPGTSATHLGKAVDSAAGSTDTGVAVLAVRDDALGGLTPAAGDYAPLHVDANGALWTHDDGLDAALSGSELQVDVVAALPAGTNAIGKLAANSGVDIGDVDILSVIPGTGASNLGKAEDAQHASADVGVMALAVRNDTLGALAGTDGDYAPLQVDASGALFIQEGAAMDVSAATVTVDNGGTFAVQVDAALPAGTNAIGKLAANSGVDIGDVDVTSISAGANAIGNVGVIPRTSGGMTIFRSIDLDESEEEVKGTAGQVFSISAFNTTAAALFLKVYNATAATVEVGTTTPVLTFVVPGNADSDGAGFIWNNAIGFAFATAITVAATTGVADNDTGAPGANAMIVDIGYA